MSVSNTGFKQLRHDSELREQPRAGEQDGFNVQSAWQAR